MRVEVGWLVAVVLAAAAILLPRYGARARFRRWRALQSRVRLEDALKHLLTREQLGERATHESLVGATGVSAQRVPGLIARIETAGLLRTRGGGFELTDAGREYATHVVRAHRLWERYLVDEAGYPLTRLHDAADRAEHRLTADELDALDARLGHPVIDPHGDPIPTARGEIESISAVPLTDWPVGTEAVILHLEDEPPAVFAALVAEGLETGAVLHTIERGPEGLTLSCDGREIRLPPVTAANVHVGPVREALSRPSGALSLTELADGREAVVVAIDEAVRGLTRRRLLDLGLTPGVTVRAELSSPFGRPRAFRVRDTLLALRTEQTDRVWVRPVGQAPRTEPHGRTERAESATSGRTATAGAGGTETP